MQKTNEDQQAQQAQQAAQRAKEKGQEVAATGKEKGQEVAGTATEKGKEVTEAAKTQVAEIGQEAAGQARNVMEDAKRQVKGQAKTQTDQIADALRRLEQQTKALLEGRPDEAGTVKDYAHQATDQIGRLAEQMQSRGFDGLVQELQRVGRNRPGAFLGGAAAAGFVVARLMRSGAVAQAAQTSDAQADGSAQQPPPGDGTYRGGG